MWPLRNANALRHNVIRTFNCLRGVQVDDPAVREALGRAASQLYAALGERMAGSDADAEVVRFSHEALIPSQ